MAISVTSVTPSNGTAFTTTASTSLTITPSGAVPSGALLYVGGTDRGSSTGTRTVTDSASNSYTRAAFAYFNNSSTRGSAQVSYVENCAAVSTSGTITYTSPVSAQLAMAAAYATGIQTSSALDVTGTATGSSTSVSGTSPTPSVSGDLVVAFAGIRSGNTAITSDVSPWVDTPGQIYPNTVGAVSAVAQYYVEPATATEAYAATLAASQEWSLVFASFKATSAATVNSNFFLLFD